MGFYLNSESRCYLNPVTPRGNILNISLEFFSQEAVLMKVFLLMDSDQIPFGTLTGGELLRMAQDMRSFTPTTWSVKVRNHSILFEDANRRWHLFDTGRYALYQLDKDVIVLVEHDMMRTKIYAICRDDFSPAPPIQDYRLHWRNPLKKK